MTTTRSFGLGLLALGLTLAIDSAATGAAEQSAPTTAASAITYTKHVAPIIQRSCQGCHRPGTNAPMSLMTYEDVRPWARAIKSRVKDRIMPPWHIERNVGIQKFKDDPSLTDAEITAPK